MSECPQCPHPTIGGTVLENGEWAIEYIPDDADFFCAEWDDDRCTIFYHSDE